MGESGRIRIEVKGVFIDRGRARSMMNLPEKAPLGRVELLPLPNNAGTRLLVGLLGAPALHLQISMIDDGCGIERDTLALIFEPFFTTKAQNQGAGFGLAAVHGILMSHEGGI